MWETRTTITAEAVELGKVETKVNQKCRRKGEQTSVKKEAYQEQKGVA